MQRHARIRDRKSLTCCSNTMNEVKSSVDSLQESMRRNYLEVISRIRGLENQRASSSSQFAGITVTESGIEGRSSGAYDLSGEGNSIQKSLSQSSRKFNHIFEKDLALTRLYKKILLRGSGSSWFSTEHPETRWSTISDLSVADIISRLSVYELAITPSELHKSEQYTGNETELHRSEQDTGDETERVSTDSPDGAIVTEAAEAIIPDVREARKLQKLWRFRDVILPEPTDLPLKNLTRSLLPRCMESEGLNQWVVQIFELKDIYRSQAPSVVLLDYIANALKYFHQYRDMVSPLTADQVLRDVLRMLGILGPDVELLETRKHVLYIMYIKAKDLRGRQVRIRRLQPDDAPFRLIRSLQISGRKPWLTIQPAALGLPTSGYVDVTDMHLGQFVDGWLLHQELYHSHVSNSQNALTWTGFLLLLSYSQMTRYSNWHSETRSTTTS